MSVQTNTILLKTATGDDLVFAEQGSGRIALVFIDEAGVPIQAAQVTSILFWLYLRDNAAQTIVTSAEILNTGRGTLGNNKTVTGGSLTSDYAVRLTVASHGYSTGDLVAVRNVVGLRGANGNWLVTNIDANTIELQNSIGSGTWSSGGTVVKGLHISLLPADNVIVQPTNVPVGGYEWHEVQLRVLYGGGGAGRLHCLVQFQVENLGLLT